MTQPSLAAQLAVCRPMPRAAAAHHHMLMIMLIHMLMLIHMHMHMCMHCTTHNPKPLYPVSITPQ